MWLWFSEYGKIHQHHDKKQKAKKHANIKTWNKHLEKNILIKKTKNHDKEILKSLGCSCDINQTRLNKYENVVIIVKPTWSCNTNSNCLVGVKSRKTPQSRICIAPRVANSAATTAIMVFTSSSGRNKTHGKGTKLAETEMYLTRPRKLTGVLPIPLRRAEIATPSTVDRSYWHVRCGCSYRSLV